MGRSPVRSPTRAPRPHPRAPADSRSPRYRLPSAPARRKLWYLASGVSVCAHRFARARAEQSLAAAAELERFAHRAVQRQVPAHRHLHRERAPARARRRRGEVCGGSGSSRRAASKKKTPSWAGLHMTAAQIAEARRSAAPSPPRSPPPRAPFSSICSKLSTPRTRAPGHRIGQDPRHLSRTAPKVPDRLRLHVPRAAPPRRAPGAGDG